MIKVPISWLAEYVDITLSPDELARQLTLRGLEVGGIIRVGNDWDKVVVGQVKTIEKHPNADRLVVLQATDGTTDYQVVTGAFNLTVGSKFPMALAGARLIDGHKLVDEAAEGKRTPPLLQGELPYFNVKPGKMRGVESTAVAVAALELGVSEDFDGIVLLDPSAPVGAPLVEVLGENILDVELSPNLGRALSMVGIAREVAAMTGQKVRLPQISYTEESATAASKIKVDIQAPDLCSRFTLAIIEGVQIGASPEWMQRRLQAAGMRPINNVVDITNYVMLEVGQPLHAYDYDTIRGQELIVRRASQGEKIETLDHVVRELNPNILVVADAERPSGLAGVMGGFFSEVTPETRTIALEGAHWNPQNIRDNARAMFAKVSEAAKRFERFVDPELTIVGVRRAAQLMQELAGGKILQGLVDEYPVKIPPRTLDFPLSEIKRYLGINIPKPAVIKMLEALEFEVTDGGNEVLQVLVPTYRNDVTIKEDLVEEIARQHGYENIPETRLQGELPPQYQANEYQFEDKLRDVLTGCGLNEVITYTLTSRETLAKLDVANPAERRFSAPGDLMVLANPLSAEFAVMRPTLTANLLETVAENRRFNSRVAIFEIGKRYLPNPPEPLPLELRTLAIALTGNRFQLSRFNPKVSSEADWFDFFDLKGVIEALVARLGIPLALKFEPAEIPELHPGRAAYIDLQADDMRFRLGKMGEIHPKVAQAFGLEPMERIGVAEIDIATLSRYIRRERYRVVTRLPVVTQDLAIVVDEETPAGLIQQVIKQTGGELLTEVTLFDLYRGKPIPEGKKNLAFRLAFHPRDKTLTEEEVTKLRQKIEGRLVKEHAAELRA